MSLAVGRRIGVEWDAVVGRRGVGSVGNNRDERHGESGRRSRSRFANNLNAGEFGCAIDRDGEVELAFAQRRERVWRRNATMIACSSTGGTVERGSFGPGRKAAVEVRRFHFATVFRLIPYRLEGLLTLS